ncbi:MAG: hypothetical protein WC010_04475 [Candidatus Absconditabacterales bacterium]
MANIDMQKHFEAEKTESNKELFSDVDLKEFNDLVKDKADFDLLVKGFEDEKTIKEIQEVKGMKDMIESFVKTKAGLADIFKNEYDSLAKDQDLYEVCVLGAILTKGKVDKANYKSLAKEYYLSLNPVAKVEVKENKPNIIGEYATASSEINNVTKTTIETKTKLEAGKKITKASVSISAGADMRQMNEIIAKEGYDNKIKELENLGKNFKDKTNIDQITNIIAELKSSKIDNISKTQAEQKGNHYLIGARVTEGFVEVLNKLAKDPEPKLTLSIDWANCVIGNVNSDKPEDKKLNINLQVTKVEKNEKEKEQKEKTLTVTTPVTKKEEGIKVKTVVEGKTKGPSTPKDKVIETTVNTGDQVNFYKSNREGNNGTASGKIIKTNTETNEVTIKEDKTGKEYVVKSNAINEKINTQKEVSNNNESKETKNLGEFPDIFIAERVRIALSKDFKRNDKAIDKDKDIQNIKTTDKENVFSVIIKDKELLFSCAKIDKDWNFDKDENNKIKVEEKDKKYYEAKLETAELKDKFKVYDVTQTDKNINIKLNETKTKEAFKTYYTLKNPEYVLDINNIIVTQDANNDLANIKTNIKFKLPATILANQKEKNITEDILEGIIFDKDGEINSTKGSVYKKFIGKNTLNLLTKDKDEDDNYKKENKNLNYNVKLSGKDIVIINDEIGIDPTTRLADFSDNKMASEVENAEMTQKTFETYTADLNANFKKRQINAKGGNEYQLLVIPQIPGVDESEYVSVNFTYKQKVNTQTQYFTFKPTDLVIPEKYTDAKNNKYFVIDNFYYRVEIPTGEQTSINPRILLDQHKTKEVALEKTNKKGENTIKEPKIEKIDNNAGGIQDRNIALLNNIRYDNERYSDFSMNEEERTIDYTRDVSLDEILGYDKDNKNKLILGTVKFDGNGEIIETTDRNIAINKKNQTLEIKDIFGRNKTLTIPFEKKEGKFIIGTNSNEKAKYIVDEFIKQKEYLKNRIYDEKASITTKLNEKIKEVGTQRASEFPGLALAVPKINSKRKEKNIPTIDAVKYLNGPTSAGLYYLELGNQYKQGNDSREEEVLYFKVNGKDVALTDMNGNNIKETYIQSNKEYKPGKGLILVTSDLIINSVKDIEQQEKGYPKFTNEPETIKRHLAITRTDKADNKNYEREVDGGYLRIFGNSKLGNITSLPIKADENNKDKYLYSQEGLKPTTAEDMAKDLRDYDNFKTLKNTGLKESELKVIFMTKFKASGKIDKATNGDNIRIKNNKGKYEYWKISSKDNGETIKFEENTISKEIQEKIVDDMKKDLIILGSIENIKFKSRRNDESKKTIVDWNKAGNWTIKDLDKKTIEGFINQETVENKKLTLQLLGPAEESITLDINDKIYQKLESKDLKNGFYEDLFESKLADDSDKEATVQSENYKVYLKSNKEKKEQRIIFESQVESAGE